LFYHIAKSGILDIDDDAVDDEFIISLENAIKSCNSLLRIITSHYVTSSHYVGHKNIVVFKNIIFFWMNKR